MYEIFPSDLCAVCGKILVVSDDNHVYHIPPCEGGSIYCWCPDRYVHAECCLLCKDSSLNTSSLNDNELIY